MTEEPDPLEALEADLDALSAASARRYELAEIANLCRSEVTRLRRNAGIEAAFFGLAVVLGFLDGWNTFAFASAGVTYNLAGRFVHLYLLSRPPASYRGGRELLLNYADESVFERMIQGMWIGVSVLLAGTFTLEGAVAGSATELGWGAFFAARAFMHRRIFREIPPASLFRDAVRRPAGGRP